MNGQPLKVTIVGYGRVGGALAQALQFAGAKVVNIGEHPDSPNVTRAVDDGFKVFPVEHIDLDVDLLVLAVPDNEIEKTASLLAESESSLEGKRIGGLERENHGSGSRTAMHLSGRLGLEPLNPLRSKGFSRLAWHPIQTFPPGAEGTRFHGITAGVTADPEALTVAEAISDLLSVRMMTVPEDRRVDYHLAAVLASNFLPLLLDMGADRLRGIAQDRGEALRALWPLVAGMVESLGNLPPEAAMSGPVVRNDLQAVMAHLDVLPEDQRPLYASLTRALVEIAHQSGTLNADQAMAWKQQLGQVNGTRGDIK